MDTGTLMSAEQFDRLPVVEGRRFELLDGRQIELSSATLLHNYILMILGAAIFPALSRKGIGAPNTEFAFGVNRFQPDLAILLGESWKKLDLERIPVCVPPDIAVEIISPSEAAIHVERKTRVYLGHGVAEVWCIYPEDHRIYVYTKNAIRMLKDDDVLTTPLLPEWSVAVRDLFPAQ